MEFKFRTRQICILITSILLLLIFQGLLLGQVIPPPPPPPPPPPGFGTIAGSVTDAATGDSLPGVNIQVLGTTIGSTTDLSGHYLILNVPPGTYDLKATKLGYDTRIIYDVPVSANDTTTQDIFLQTISDSFVCVDTCYIIRPEPKTEEENKKKSGGIVPAEKDTLVIRMWICNESTKPITNAAIKIPTGSIGFCGDNLVDFYEINEIIFYKSPIGIGDCGPPEVSCPLTKPSTEFRYAIDNLEDGPTKKCLIFRCELYTNLTTSPCIIPPDPPGEYFDICSRINIPARPKISSYFYEKWWFWTFTAAAFAAVYGATR